MAQQPQQQPQAEPAAAEAKKGLPLKTIVVVLLMLVGEAGLILGVVTMFGKPSEVKGVELDHKAINEGETLVEIPVVAEKFTNNASGRVWVWDTEIAIKVKKKHAGEAHDDGGKKDKKGGHGGGHGEGEAGAGSAAPGVRDELASRMAEIRTGIGSIWSGAQQTYFTEPGRETLSRQVLEYLRTVFGQDAEGQERIQDVLIPKCLGFPADY